MCFFRWMEHELARLLWRQFSKCDKLLSGVGVDHTISDFAISSLVGWKVCSTKSPLFLETFYTALHLSNWFTASLRKIVFIFCRGINVRYLNRIVEELKDKPTLAYLRVSFSSIRALRSFNCAIFPIETGGLRNSGPLIQAFVQVVHSRRRSNVCLCCRSPLSQLPSHCVPFPPAPCWCGWGEYLYLAFSS